MLSILMQIPSSAYRVVVIDRTTSVEMPRATSAMVVELLLGSIVRLMAGIFHGLVVTPLVAFHLLGAEPATAYAILLHAIQMVCLLALGLWGISRLGINLDELLAETRKRVRRDSTHQEVAN